MIQFEWLVSGHHDTKKWVAGIENNFETENHFPYDINVGHHESYKKIRFPRIADEDIYYKENLEKWFIAFSKCLNIFWLRQN